MLVIQGPYCKDWIIIEQLNCCIFRHGVFKSNLTQINPHLSKLECNKLKEQDLIFGCGKPFKIINNIAIECDYI